MSTHTHALSTEYGDTRVYSWHSMLASLDDAAPHWVDRRSRAVDDNGWRGGLTWEEQVRLTRGDTSVWANGAAEIQRTAREHAQRIITARRPTVDYMPGTEGVMFDVAAVVQGLPDPWLYPTASDRGDRSTIRLVIDMGASASVDAETLQARSTAIAACVLTLQSQQAVEVILHFGTHRPGKRSESIINVVHVNEPGTTLDISRLAAIAHVGFFRRVCFSLHELTPSKTIASKYAGTYGYCGTMTESILHAAWGRNVVAIGSDVGMEGVAKAIEDIHQLIRHRGSRKGN